MMHLLYIIYCLACAHAKAALNSVQKPLSIPLSEAKPGQPTLGTTKPVIRVGIDFDSASSVDLPGKQFVEIPIGTRISPFDFPSLPLYPLHARIINASSYDRNSRTPVSFADLDDIICVAYPEIVEQDSNELQYQRKAPSVETVYPVWWNVKDGEIDFQDALNRCFLAGRGVESYECL